MRTDRAFILPPLYSSCGLGTAIGYIGLGRLLSPTRLLCGDAVAVLTWVDAHVPARLVKLVGNELLLCHKLYDHADVAHVELPDLDARIRVNPVRFKHSFAPVVCPVGLVCVRLCPHYTTDLCSLSSGQMTYFDVFVCAMVTKILPIDSFVYFRYSGGINKNTVEGREN